VTWRNKWFGLLWQILSDLTCLHSSIDSWRPDRLNTKDGRQKLYIVCLPSSILSGGQMEIYSLSPGGFRISRQLLRLQQNTVRPPVHHAPMKAGANPGSRGGLCKPWQLTVDSLVGYNHPDAWHDTSASARLEFAKSSPRRRGRGGSFHPSRRYSPLPPHPASSGEQAFGRPNIM
jgi:hypothetical protein